MLDSFIYRDFFYYSFFLFTFRPPLPRHSSYEEEYISSHDRAEREAVYEGVASRLYNPVNQTWSQHWPGVNHLVRDNYLEDEERQGPLLSGSQ